MGHLGNFQRRLLGLAVTLAVAGSCTEPVPPEPAGAPRTSSSALAVEGPVLVADLNTTWPGTNPGSAPSGFVSLGSTVLFTAHEASSGRELWTSDTTESGTQLLKDIRPGTESSSPSGLVAMGNAFYFTADDGSTGRELWRTDGTTSGTVLVRDIQLGSGSSNPTSLTVFNGVLYFSATDGNRGLELWRSDGTAQGTVLVRDILSGAAGPAPQHLTAAGNLLFFSAATGTGRELWRSDGTSSGTQLVRDLIPGLWDGFISDLVSVGNRVFFIGMDFANGAAVWTSDGTSAGTRLVHDPRPGEASPTVYAHSLTEMGGKLYFASMGRTASAAVGTELWASDGNTAWLVKDIVPGTGSSSPEELVAVGSTLYFRANDGSTGSELWKSDGTEAGTQRVADIAPGSPSSVPQQLTGIQGVLYFSANDGPSGRELWRSDGTPSGTRRVMDLHFGPADTHPEGMTAVGGRVIFSADGTGWGAEPWWTAGEDYHQVKDIHVLTADSDPRALTVLGDTLYFTADVEELGREPWRTSASGPQLLQDIHPGPWSSDITRFVPMNGAVLFDANNGVNGQELWTSNGTPSGTRLLKDIQAGGLSGAPRDLQVVRLLGDRLLFFADDGRTGFEPWVSNGTDSGTQLIEDLWAGTASSAMSGGIIGFQGRGYFGASDRTGSGLWQTQGSPSLTFLVTDVVPHFDRAFAATPSVFYFPGSVGTTDDVELWRSEGDDWTFVISDINPSGSSWPDDFVLMDDVLYFSATHDGTTRSFWRSHGTGESTQSVVNVFMGTTGFNPRHLTVANRVLFFQAYDLTSGIELMRSDGTRQGTRRVKDIHPGLSGSLADQPILALEPEGLVVFAASDGVHGLEPWISDGTEAGTRMLADLAPGAYSSNPRLFTRQGQDLYFVANDGTTGSELWRVRLNIPPDTTPPTVTCPASQTVESQTRTKTEVTYAAATVTDATPGRPLLSYNYDSGTRFPLGTTTVIATATDAYGNVGSCSFTITVQDTIAPRVTCPADVTVEATDSTGAIVSYPAAQVFEYGSAPQVTYSQATGTLFSLGTTVVTVTARDTPGNTSSCTFNVTVRDTALPAVTCPASVTAEATGASGALVSYPPATASDATSPPVTLSYSQDSGTLFPFGETVVTATATDASGNSATCTFSVTVHDTLAPVLSCPTDVIAEATDASGASVSYAPATASDAVTAAPELTYSQGSGTVFVLGTTGVTVTARDAAGNTASCAFNVIVRDTTAPSLTCPTEVIAEATDASGTAVGYLPATASDAVTASPVFTYSQASGTTFPVGTTRVLVTATDAAGNAGTCAFNITVRDTRPPILTCPADATVEATGSNGTTVSYPAATATDAVTASPTLTYSQASGTLFPLGATTVTATASDAAGNTGTCSFTVTVRDTTAPALSCPADVVAEAASADGATVSIPAATATDAVTASPTLMYSQATGTRFSLGTTGITVTATDAAGNTATCSFNVTVQDTTRPAVTCPLAVTAEATGASGASVGYVPATASDAVTTSPVLAYSHAAGTVFPLGVTTVSVTATDEAGNAATCAFDVTVRDTTAPTVSCSVDVTEEATSADGATVSYAAASASDAVTASPTLTYSHASGTLFPPGITAITVTATDAAGNTASCRFNVTVRDATTPTVTCPANVTAEATDASGATVSYPPATASDTGTASPTLSYSQASDTVFPLGTTTVTVTATDDAGNSQTCAFTMTVRDTTAPNVGCTADLTVEAEGPDGTIVPFELAQPLDAVTRAPQVSASHGSGSRFPLGTTAVTVTARDDADNTASCTFTITVQDTTAPTLVCPADLPSVLGDTEGAAVTFSATATDTVTASPEVTYSHAPGSRFPLGATPVTVTARDAAGLTAECTFQVTVREPVSVPEEAALGFGCSTGSSSGSGPGAWFLLMGGALWLQRRTRSRVH
jgi:ELWxxDGT repeat protein